MCEKTFLYSHEYCDKEWGEKCAKRIFKKHTNSASKKCWEKIVANKCEKLFLYSHEYRDKKWEGKNARNNFSETRIVRKKMLGKNRRKKVKKYVILFTRIS